MSFAALGMGSMQLNTKVSHSTHLQGSPPKSRCCLDIGVAWPWNEDGYDPAEPAGIPQYNVQDCQQVTIGGRPRHCLAIMRDGRYPSE